MLVEASVPGLFRTLVIIVGVIFLLRFLAQFVTAKRNMETERDLNADKRAFEEEKRKVDEDLGKTKIRKSSATTEENIEDVDFEELE